MEPIHDRPASTASPQSATTELVIQNGRLKGTARPLLLPLTLVGRSADCDLRLNLDGIHAVHCLLAQTAEGLMLRDLAGDGTTTVNGRSASAAALQHGDLLCIGPFQFQVRLVGRSFAEQLVDARGQLGQEKEALRIQAAAVAAQQAALIEDEARLQQRHQALEQQEEQLASHLEEKRQRLLELRDQIKQAHSTLKSHKARHGAQLGEAMQEVEAGRREIGDGRQQLAKERRRLRTLLRRMRQRYHRQWAGERESIAAREAEVERQRQALEEERSRLEREAAGLLQSRLRLNGDFELARRQLKEEWTILRQEELRRDEQHAQQAAELETWQRELSRREAALGEGEQELDEQRHDWREVHQELELEVEGLQTRARNFRRKINDLEGEVVRLQSAAADPVPANSVNATALVPATPAGSTGPTQPPEVLAEPLDEPAALRLGQLERLAGELADQRAHVAEQWERLLAVQQRWQQHYQTLVRELDATGRQLHEREQALAARDHSMVSGEERLRQRQQEALQLQRQLEAWQSRMTARETAWEGDRDRLLAKLQAQQKLAERRLGEVRQLHERWTKRRRRELAWLQSERAACSKLRQECADLRTDWLQKDGELQEAQRSLAERSLALEQYQQEVLGRATNPASAERRLHRIRLRWATQLAESQKTLQAERHQLTTDTTEYQERYTRLQKQLTRLHQREEELAERLRKWEEERLRSADELANLREELNVARAHRDRYETQVTELRDEVERIARLLIDETPPMLALPMSKEEPPAQAA